MITVTLNHLATIVGGQVRDPAIAGERTVRGVTIDSRQVAPGDLFVPIIAQRDGHDFVSQATATGATGYLCQQDHALATAPDAPSGAILVPDTVEALTKLGQWHRDTVDPIVVGVTGSNGKTTTKDLIAAALGSVKPVVATKGSFNNELGLPLTLCTLTEDTEVLVSEIGARGIGHIKAAMPILRPSIGVVTTIGAAHVGAFGSEAAIAEAKGELVEALPPEGLAILNADNPACAELAGRTSARVQTVGTKTTADLHPDNLSTDAHGRVTFCLDGQLVRAPLPGIHQTTNMLAAIAVADALDIPRIHSLPALAHARVSPMRMASTTVGQVTIIDDTYNANEGSIIAALDTLAAIRAPRRIAVLGMVHDLEDQLKPTLSRIAQYSEDIGIETLVSVNAQGLYRAGRDDTHEAASLDEAVDLLISLIGTQPAVVLVKASRAEGLEYIVSALTTHLEQAA
ncbi:UDP-N-acetylmuramoyl-tripeptide--D-alanyl-D-alanine ligase [Stomatohabitans albus]|uniref:UDP-N-acetylmuramoyl-tripeptide--D-alanyl-D- alanine ligase n=1 Tax=Stomatohabitans albus TaxID=3110766 RepID=UPI00300DB090